MSEAGGSGDDGPAQTRRSEDAALSARLRDLDRRIVEKRPERGDDMAAEAAPRPGFAMAFRLSADFVAGVLVGAGLGWGFDALLGTTPWGLIVFLLLGFAAGVLNVLRTAGMVAKRPGIDDDPVSRRFE